MQDNYIGDIGDYGKYGLLRAVCENQMSLAINWYKVTPKKAGKQDDGKFTSYLDKPEIYRQYDSELFSVLRKIVCDDNDRSIKRIECENIFEAKYFSDDLEGDRAAWHQRAMMQTSGADVVFLDPDNGLETLNMHNKNKAKEKHVKWNELKDYYDRGQNIILYQHRPQMTKKEKCIEGIMQFQKEYLKADGVKLLEFPKYTNRFYFIFYHNEYKASFENVCNFMALHWGAKDFCREINLD